MGDFCICLRVLKLDQIFTCMYLLHVPCSCVLIIYVLLLAKIFVVTISKARTFDWTHLSTVRCLYLLNPDTYVVPCNFNGYIEK